MSEVFISRHNAGGVPSFDYSGRVRISNYGGQALVAFLTSGTYTARTSLWLEFFLVGGGQGGHDYEAGGNSGCVARGRIFVNYGERYNFVIGAGGYGVGIMSNSTTQREQIGPINFGKDTTITRIGEGTPRLSAGGGRGYYVRAAMRWEDVQCASGAGVGPYYQSEVGKYPDPVGGVDGGDGQGKNGCPGSGRTTRAFGEPDGQIYAQGGGGDTIYIPDQFYVDGLCYGGGRGCIDSEGWMRATSGAPNTGSGGGGSQCRHGSSSSTATYNKDGTVTWSYPDCAPGDGGSGVILMRKALWRW